MGILLFAILTLAGCLSPLLTYAALWQVKEWRMDRLREHLGREGWISQLFGNVRPVVLGAWGVVTLVAPTMGAVLLLGCVAVLAGLSVVQILLRRQRRPVWTKKALVIVVGAGVLDMVGAVVVAASTPFFLPFLVLIQPAVITIVWVVFLPLDSFLKNRILQLARSARSQYPDLTVIGVTGSVGKTTTKELLACVLQDLHPLVTPAHVNSELGVAQWLIGVLAKAPEAPSSENRVLVVEMGAYREGEIALMSSYVQQTHGVVTFVGAQHLALFGSEEKLFRAKSELVTHLPATGRAYLNGDNDLCRRLKDLAPCPVTLVGTGGQDDVEAYDIEEVPGGIRFRAFDTTFTLPLHGTHNVTNALLAIAVARDLGVELPKIAELLRCFRPPAHTFAVRNEGTVRVLDDTHNSSPASVKAAIAWARTQPYAAKTLLLSGLLELGEAQERTEREIGALAEGVFQRIIVINPRSLRNVTQGAGSMPVELFGPEAKPVAQNSLLVCVGRMPLSSIIKLLPSSVQ